MNEKALRWKARIGQSKLGCGIVLFIAIILACVGASLLSTALKNPGGQPHAVTLQQLVAGEMSNNTYVRITGLAAYDWANYWVEEDGQRKETYYFLVDADTGHMILIKHHSPYIIVAKSGEITLTGMVRPLSSSLRKLVQEDEGLFRKERLQTNFDIYIADGQSPPNLPSSAVLLIVGLLGCGLGVIPFFFPGNVFAPHAVNRAAPRPAQRPALTVTGKFQKLKHLDPLEIGKTRQNFTRAIGNLIFRGERELMVYIHHIVRTKTYGVTVSTTESDWAVFINSANVQSIRAGKLYGWKDTWGLALQYTDDRGKGQKLYLHFEDEGSLAQTVEMLEQMRFVVELGAGDEMGL